MMDDYFLLAIFGTNKKVCIERTYVNGENIQYLSDNVMVFAKTDCEESEKVTRRREQDRATIV